MFFRRRNRCGGPFSFIPFCKQHPVGTPSCIQPGALDLQTVFGSRGQHNIPLANDTSIGVGYAPLSPLERLVLAIERQMNDRDRSANHPAWGEDVKVMGIRRGATVDLTIACAMIGRHLSHMDDYLAEKVP